MNERGQLQRHGQLVRKEFMLRDSASWPTINLPGNAGTAYPQQSMGYPNDVMAHMNRSQQQAYMQQQQANASQRGAGPSPAKRPRHGGPGHAHGSATAIPAPVVSQDPTNEEEDGTVGGDYMDYLTPRDISLHRYIQHHEWLEQILESPYDTDRIIPGDLGLGRKGELESLTRDFFDAPTNGTPKEKFPINNPPPEENYVPPVPPRVGRLEAGQAEEFTKRATEKIAQINSEIEKLKKQHARRMAKLRKTNALRGAEEELRIETLEIINGDSSKIGNQQDGRINDIALNAFGKSVESVHDVECIEKGGLEEKSENKENIEHDYDMVDNFNINDALDNVQPQVTTETAAQNPTLNAGSVVQASHNQLPEPETLPSEATHVHEGPSSAQPPLDTAAEDWIMVNKDGNPAAVDEDLGDLNSFVNDAAMQSSIGTPDFIDNTVSDQPQKSEQMPDNLVDGDFGPGAEGDTNTAELESHNFDEGIDFGDLDTTGDGLSGYAQAIEDPELGENDVLGSSDGAFGSTFPVTEPGARSEAPDI